jgi:flagellar hook assembly protein FlgD
LGQNFPNPFSARTEIPYQLAKAAKVKITVYNYIGERIATLADGFQTAGSYKVEWNGTDNNGIRLESGMYFYKMEIGEKSTVRKAILLTK